MITLFTWNFKRITILLWRDSVLAYNGHGREIERNKNVPRSWSVQLLLDDYLHFFHLYILTYRNKKKKRANSIENFCRNRVNEEKRCKLAYDLLSAFHNGCLFLPNDFIYIIEFQLETKTADDSCWWRLIIIEPNIITDKLRKRRLSHIGLDVALLFQWIWMERCYRGCIIGVCTSVARYASVAHQVN